MRRVIYLFAIVALVAGMAACGQETETPSGADALRVTEPWARSPVADKAAVYFIVTNDGTEGDRLVDAAAPGLEAMVGIHETLMQDGVAEMGPVEGVDVPAGTTVTFEPGGYHVMLEDMAEPLEVGATVTITLTFEQAGDVTIDADVRAFVEDEDGM